MSLKLLVHREGSAQLAENRFWWRYRGKADRIEKFESSILSCQTRGCPTRAISSSLLIVRYAIAY